jgi:hypothetical protein
MKNAVHVEAVLGVNVGVRLGLDQVCEGEDAFLVHNWFGSFVERACSS